MRADGVDLVTGGAGFIGSHLVAELIRQGRAVRVVDDLSTGDLRRLDDLKDRVQVVRADLAADDLTGVFTGVERVFHLAAVPSVPRSVKDPERAHGSNATAALRVLIAARDARVARVVLSSSSSVYGETAALPKREDLTPVPLSPYAVAKLASEGYGRVFARLYGLHVVSLRYFNVFGPSQDPDSPYSAVIPLFITRALAGLPLIVFGDGEQTRDFTYVENVVRANLAAATTDASNGEVYNVATGEPLSINALITALGRILDVRPAVEHGPPRPGDIRHSHADVSAAARDLGWRPSVSVEQGLRETAAWYRARLPLGSRPTTSARTREQPH